MKAPFVKIREATRIWRERFGTLAGGWLWVQLLKEHFHRPGTVFSIRVPGYRAPIYLRAHTTDVDVLSQIFAIAELDVEGLPSCPDYIIDAGANIGLSSLYFARTYPAADIDAIEIANDNLIMLRMNTSAYPNIRIIPKGLWHRPCALKIENPEDPPYAYRVCETNSDDPSHFEATSVDELLADRGKNTIDIMKVDIEGSEKEVFEDSAAWAGKITCAMVELHDRFKPGCHEAVASAFKGRPVVHRQKGEYHIYLSS